MKKDTPKPTRREKKKPLVVPPYSELHMQINHYGGENTKKILEPAPLTNQMMELLEV